MPESKVRGDAKRKKQARKDADLKQQKAEASRLGGGGREWVPWVFVPVGLLGVLWMIVYNLAGSSLGFMTALGGWNVVVGLGLIVASFGLMTLWK